MKREEPHCKAVRLFPLVEHREFVWLTCGGGDGSRTNSRRSIVKKNAIFRLKMWRCYGLKFCT